MRRSVVIGACCIIAGATAGCGSSGPPAAPAPATPAAPADPGKPLIDAMLGVQARMHLRFAATHDMHEAIALSDLARAQQAARLVASLDEPDALPAWQPYVEDIRAAAREVIATADPAAAATTMARLGRSCARCHEALHARIELASEPPPAPDPHLRSTMAGHHWAASRMWEGLFAPSNARWLAGARALEAAPLAITADIGAPPGEPAIADDVARIRLLARRALDTGDLDARSTLYGELLGTCVRCHHTIRDR